MPPGFVHELPRHIQARSNEPDEKLGVPVIDFNQTCCGAHGFAVLIKTEVDGDTFPHYTLLDTGPDSTTLLRNISALRIDLDDVSTVVVSHWHSDHTGGLLSFLKERSTVSKRECVVDLHPDRPLARGIAPGPKYTKIVAALPQDPTPSQISELGAAIHFHDEPHTVAESTVWVSGEIPRITGFEPGMLGGVRWLEEDGEGHWAPEPEIMDERYIAVDVFGKGLVVFSSCSHAGIVNVVKDAITKHNRPIYMIIGGLHLAPPDYTDSIEPTVRFLSETMRPAPTYVLPVHCTGFAAKTALKDALGDGCVPAGVGIRVEVDGDRSHDGNLRSQVY